MNRVLIAIAMILVGLLASTSTQADQKRGFENYQAVMAGKKQFSDLTVEEQQEVMIIYRILNRSKAPTMRPTIVRMHGRTRNPRQVN